MNGLKLVAKTKTKKQPGRALATVKDRINFDNLHENPIKLCYSLCVVTVVERDRNTVAFM